MGEKSKKFCDYCGASLPEVNYRFCGNCGQSQLPTNDKEPGVVASYISDLKSQGKIMTTQPSYRTSRYESGNQYGLYTFFGVLYGSIAFWVSIWMMFNWGGFGTIAVFIILFIVAAIVIGTTGEENYRKKRVTRFVVGGITSVVGWVVLGFLLIVGFLILYY